MSADNYLFVRPWRGRFVAEERCASEESVDQRQRPNATASYFATAQDAINWALDEDRTGYYEYGVRFDWRVRA